VAWGKRGARKRSEICRKSPRKGAKEKNKKKRSPPPGEKKAGPEEKTGAPHKWGRQARGKGGPGLKNRIDIHRRGSNFPEKQKGGTSEEAKTKKEKKGEAAPAADLERKPAANGRKKKKRTTKKGGPKNMKRGAHA